jgi:colanic acid biosynthesis glycosyl transferase WcaI
MRILFFADNFPPETNAQASRVFERARYWIRWGHSVTVITCAPNFPEGKLHPGFKNRWRQTEVMAGIRVVRVKTFIAANRGKLRRMADYLSFLPGAVWAGLFEETPDIVAATTPQMFAALAGWTVGRLRRRPFLLEVADLWPESLLAVGAMRKPNLVIRGLARLASFLYERADRIVVLTEAFREKIAGAGVAREKIDVILNGVDLERYRPCPRDAALARHWGISPNRFVVGYIGTLGMAHGLENVLDAAKRLEKTPLLFLMVGSGAERDRLQASAIERGLNNAMFVPAQPKEAMPSFWSLCDLALVHLRNTPLFETVIPSKIFEAMGMGLPILLAAPKGEASKIVLEEGVGVHLRAGDPEELASALESLMASRNTLDEMGARSAVAARRYSRERQARLYLASLESASGSVLNSQDHTLGVSPRKRNTLTVE